MLNPISLNLKGGELDFCEASLTSSVAFDVQTINH